MMLEILFVYMGINFFLLLLLLNNIHDTLDELRQVYISNKNVIKLLNSKFLTFLLVFVVSIILLIFGFFIIIFRNIYNKTR